MILTNSVINAARLVAALDRYEPTTMRTFMQSNPDLSMHFMDQIARRLRQAGFIRSVRGKGGGYCLVNRDITALDLIYCLSRERLRTDDLTAAVEKKLGEIMIAHEERAHHVPAH